MVGIATRLLALPWAETVNGDAVSRTYLAWAWSEAPHWISADIWLPLGTYVTGISLWVLPFPFWTPVLLNSLLTIAAALCLWAFTRRELRGRDAVTVRDEQASRFVAIAFLLTPLAFRNSLMALSEPLYILLLSLLMLCLSAARQAQATAKGQLGATVLAGLCLTLAAASRYEAWPLIPVMALLLWHRPKLMVVFGLVAAAFPLYWLVSNQLQYGDALHMIKFQSLDTAEILADSGGMTLTRRLVRLVFFPMTLAFGMTFGVLVLSLVGIGRSWKAGAERAMSLVWLAPFLMMLALLVYKATSGTLNLEVRYSLALMLFLLPYAAVGVRSLSVRWQALLGLSIFPLGYLLYLAQPLAQPLLKGIERSPAEYTAPIPRINAPTRRIITLLQEHRTAEPVMVWGFEAYQVAQQVVFHSGLAESEQLPLSETFSPKKWAILLSTFTLRNTTGLLLVETAKHPTLPAPGSPTQVMDFGDVALELTPISTDGPAVLYRYRRL